MLVIVLVVFVAVFAVVALAMTVMGGGPSKQVKQRLGALTGEVAPAHFEDGVTDIKREEQLSRIPWLNRWLVRINIASRTRMLLYQADVKQSVGTLLMTSAIGWLVVGCGLYLRTGYFLSSFLIGAAFIPLPLFYVLRKRASRFGKFEQKLPEALDMLVSALRVGHSLVTGIGALGQESTEPITREFRKLFDEQNFGIDLRTAMINLTLRVPLQDVRIFVAAVLIQKESGGNLAEVLEKVAQTTRERFRLKKQISVHTAQGRLTGWILSALPVALGFGMYLVNPESISVLWKRPIGLKMLYTAVGMTTVGSLIIQKIVRIKV
jgi:tight adherence protein B